MLQNNKSDRVAQSPYCDIAQYQNHFRKESSMADKLIYKKFHIIDVCYEQEYP
jgi:hypothetical protein